MLYFLPQPPNEPSTASNAATFEMYHPVRLLAESKAEGHVLAAGTEGVLVEKFSDHDFGIDFDEPIDNVFIIPAALLERA